MYKTLSAGVAIFAMLFGAGNVVFPLALGREAGSVVGWATLGFLISAVLVPLLGLISMVLYDGNYRVFLGRLGKIPGAVLAFICLVLIGPFGAIPRCINTAYAATKFYYPDYSLFYFAVLSSVIAFLFAIKPGKVIDIIGQYLGPLKLILLLSIIIGGVFFVSGTPEIVDMTPMSAVLKGLIDGYGTMDLLGTLFFAGLIIGSLKENSQSSKALAIEGVKAGSVGALLLGLIYGGFCFVAAQHGPSVADVNKYELLNSLAPFILGKHGGILTNIAVAVSCLVTSIALTTVFSEYLQKSIFREKVPYVACLLITSVLNALMANLGFAKIMTLLVPVIIACYPALIILSIVNILHKLFGFRYVKMPVFATFGVTLIGMLI